MEIFYIFLSLLVTVLASSGQSTAEDTYANCINVNKGPTYCPFYKHGTDFNTMQKFRTIDGTCNNLRKPNYGAINTKLRRLLPAQYDDGVNLPRGHPKASDYENIPTAHQVSKAVLKAFTGQVKNDRNMSVLFMTFGQFLDHDLTFSPHESCNVTDCSKEESSKYPCMPIKFEKHHSRCFGFAQSKPACKTDPKEHRSQLNELTSFLDLSQVYGADDETAHKVRTNDGSGELKVDAAGLLPIDIKESKKASCRNPAGCPIVGDERGDENIALLAMHTLWVRQHNYLAKKLKNVNKRWQGERIFQEARKINGALWQHIVYNEWLPKLYDIPEYSKFVGNKKKFKRTKYDSSKDPSIINSFASAAFRFGHSLVPNQFSQMKSDFNEYGPSIPLQKAFFNSTSIYKNGIEPTMMGLCANMTGSIDGNIAQGLKEKLFIFPGSNLFNDLMSLNIQRGRDHGIPTYMHWRRACGFAKYDQPGFSFKDLLYTPKVTQMSFAKVYNHIEDVDLFVGGLTENHLRDKVVGPTFSCIFKEQFESLRFGDRFFYTHRGRFSTKQLKEITKISMSKILCNNLYSMVSIQPDSFKVFNIKDDRRISCDDLPDININLWRERGPGRPSVV